MKNFTVALLVINLAVFSWLIVGARTELPPWQEAFDDARTAINDIEQKDKTSALEKAVSQSRFKTAEGWSRITIDEYRRSDGSLVVLTILNIIGLSIIALKNRRESEQVVESDVDKPPL